MLFYTVSTPEERRRIGGALLEIQYCRLPRGSALKKIVAVDSIENRKSDSLYVPDENEFVRLYGAILGDGCYNNRKSGPLDPYGINYYAPETVAAIRARLRNVQPAEHAVFDAWLANAEAGNGFYILGL